MPGQTLGDGTQDYPGDPLGHLVDQETLFRKTVSESDVYLFAGITGDLSENHVDRQAMQDTEYGERIAHGMLVLSFMSTGSTRLIERVGGLAVSYGYDHVRFVAPVYFGDTITVHYRVTGVDPERSRSFADVRVMNQRSEVVAVAQHILAWRERRQAAAVDDQQPKDGAATDDGQAPSKDPSLS
ncbi:MaoC family dehydratase [Pedococcus sp. 5OH_020]|uniref:MaoC family dehydratase n=1 Tax=Pedococcus sp. 5OH_020 TaxID=2989814 RepID=UPI0022EA0E8E|nr:MaoC/PaaZ C-terminal domain-containing protein [Pedococcus sp. 5OH_020]